MKRILFTYIVCVSLLLATLVLFSACPFPGGSGGSSPQKLVLFGTDTLYMADLGGRSGADRKVSNDAARPPGLKEVHALLSVDASDTVRAMPQRYGFSPDLPIVGPDGVTKIADNWEDLLDGDIDSTLMAAGVLDASKGPAWWSGSKQNGGLADNAEGWTLAESSVQAVAGRSDVKDSYWVCGEKSLSDGELQLIGIGVSTEPADGYVPLEGLSLNAESISMTVGDTVQMEAIFSPSDASPREVHWYTTSHGSQPYPFSVDSEGCVTAMASSYKPYNQELVAVVHTPEGERIEARCSITVLPKHIVLFVTEELHSSDVREIDFPSDKEFTSLSSLLFNDPAKPQGYAHVVPFAGLGDKDPVSFSTIYADRYFLEDIPVIGPDPNETVIADSWADLLDGNIKTSLLDAGLESATPLNSGWWSGLNSDGSYASGKNARNWQDVPSDAFPVIIGSMDSSDSSWISDTPLIRDSEAKFHFLGAAW